MDSPAADDAADNADDADDDAADDAADNAAADDAADDADADDGEIVAAVAAEDVSVSAEAVDAVIEEEEEELIDEEAVEEEVELVDEEEVDGESGSGDEIDIPFLMIGGKEFFQYAEPVNGKYVWSAQNNTGYWPYGWAGTLTFDPNGENGETLTLENVSFVTGDIGLLYSDKPIGLDPTEAALDGMNMSASSSMLTINLVGTNEIKIESDNNTRRYAEIVDDLPSPFVIGMDVEMPLCIEGKGTLNLRTSMLERTGGTTLGIRCEDLTIEDAPTINVTAGEAVDSIGIAIMNNMSITGGTLTAQSEGVIEFQEGVLSEAGGALMEVGSSEGFAAGAVVQEGELSLGDKMQLKYGKDASSATVHTAGEFNAITEKADRPLYFRVEPKPTNPDTPAAPAGRPDPSFPIDTLFFATVVSEGTNALKLAWTPANNVDGYDVFLKRCNAKKKAPFKLVGTSTGLGCTVNGLNTNLNLNFNIFTASFPPCLR